MPQAAKQALPAAAPAAAASPSKPVVEPDAAEHVNAIAKAAAAEPLPMTDGETDLDASDVGALSLRAHLLLV